MVMKDIEALMEQAKNGDQSAFDYLYDNSLGVFALDLKDYDKLYDFLEECVGAGLDIQEYIDTDELLEYYESKKCKVLTLDQVMNSSL